jgi:hypothetical protein
VIVMWASFLVGGGLEPVSKITEPSLEAGSWRRTVDGWENMHRWQAPAYYRPKLQPHVVAAFELLASLLALIACQKRLGEQSDFSHARCTDGAAAGHY